MKKYILKILKSDLDRYNKLYAHYNAPISDKYPLRNPEYCKKQCDKYDKKIKFIQKCIKRVTEKL